MCWINTNTVELARDKNTATTPTGKKVNGCEENLFFAHYELLKIKRKQKHAWEFVLVVESPKLFQPNNMGLGSLLESKTKRTPTVRG